MMVMAFVVVEEKEEEEKARDRITKQIRARRLSIYGIKVVIFTSFTYHLIKFRPRDCCLQQYRR